MTQRNFMMVPGVGGWSDSSRLTHDPQTAHRADALGAGELRRLLARHAAGLALVRPVTDQSFEPAMLLQRFSIHHGVASSSVWWQDESVSAGSASYLSWCSGQDLEPRGQPGGESSNASWRP